MVRQCQWWCPPEEYADVQDDWFIHFFQRGCLDFEGLDSTRIEVYSVFGDWSAFSSLTKDSPNRNVVRFLFVGENVQWSTDHPSYPHVDAILTFFEDTPKSIRMPLWTIYWRFDEHGLFEIPEGYHRKDRAVIVVSHDQTRVRNMICQKVLREYHLPIDTTLPSLSHTHVIPPPPKGVRSKMECLSTYRYNICPENSCAHGYVTEKIFQSLAVGCIPIYWGGTIPVEPRVLRQDAIIDIQGAFRPNLNVSDQTVWTDDAIVYIYATYLKVWSIAYRKLRKDACRRRQGIVIQKYECESLEACADQLVSHWKTFRRFWTPRPVFRIPILSIAHVPAFQELEMEDLAEEVFRKYPLRPCL